MDKVIQSDEAFAVPLGAGCGEHGEVDPSEIDLTTGLYLLSCLVQDIYARVAERQGLTPVQAKLLCAVEHGPRGMGELAQGFGVEKAALTGLVDRAERRGLAERATVPGDRRALCVVPTEAGRKAVTTFKAEVTAELQRLVAGLSPDDREQLRGTVADVVTGHMGSMS